MRQQIIGHSHVGSRTSGGTRERERERERGRERVITKLKKREVLTAAGARGSELRCRQRNNDVLRVGERERVAQGVVRRFRPDDLHVACVAMVRQRATTV